MRLPPLKGKTLHEQLFDPATFKLGIKKDFNAKSKESFSGITPNLFVGRFGYPDIRVGVLSTQEYIQHDNPNYWSSHNSSLQEIITKRMDLVNAGTHMHVKLPSTGFSSRLRNIAQEAAMSVRPITVDISLEKKPLFSLSLHDTSLPHGPSVEMKSAQITSNPKIPSYVDSLVEATDVHAQTSIDSLWKKGYTEHHLTKLLTAGLLGTSLQRRLVPTRWGITAVDDMIGKQLHKTILTYPEIDFCAYFSGYLGNYFLVLFFPQSWSYELFENAVGKHTVGGIRTEFTDYEPVAGRKHYAEHTAGGYYAARTAVLEFLQSQKRQGGVLALRFISEEYWAPAGVWVVREAVRKSLQTKEIVFGDEASLLSYASDLCSERFSVDISPLLSASRLLYARRTQTRLNSYF